MPESLEQKIISSYQLNADAWTEIIAKEGIKSRQLVTNKAIVDAVLSHQPVDVLDVGCGEGWLVRALIDQSINATGIDGVEALVNSARKRGKGIFEICQYEDIEQCPALAPSFDVIVCNFALLGEQSTQDLLSACANKLVLGKGRLLIQTLHPLLVNSSPYFTGWKEGSWAGFPDTFTEPPDWYFRTLEDWLAVFSDAGLVLLGINEPRHPQTGEPASIIFNCASV